MSPLIRSSHTRFPVYWYQAFIARNIRALAVYHDKGLGDLDPGFVRRFCHPVQAVLAKHGKHHFRHLRSPDPFV